VILEGLSGSETNPAPDGTAVVVHEVDKSAPNAYYSPGADPGEGFTATNARLFGSAATAGEPTNQGFVTDYAATLA
jgi:phospholipase C